jgi:hypothetical protein
MTYKPLCTAAWRLVNIANEPGILELVDGYLAWINLDGEVFKVPLAEIANIDFPWYYFNGGMKFNISGERYRISFIQPNNSPNLPDMMLEKIEFGTGFCGSQKAGRAWKSVFAAKMSLQKTSA